MVERRLFLSSVVGSAMSIAAGSSVAAGPQPASPPAAPEFYLWRQYTIRIGSQPRRLAEYFQRAALPALNRLGHKPVGVFDVVAGIPGPSLFLLIPLATLNALPALEAGLDRDEQYLRDAAAYIDATPGEPAFVRQEAALLSAVPLMPRIEVPAATAKNGPRLFELRTYESPSEKAHRAKVRMFAELGELDIFRRVGLTPVFFSRTLVGSRMPSLVYMLVHENLAGREKSWETFRNDPEWKKLSATPGYTDAEIVSNITTVYLRPSAYSQI